MIEIGLLINSKPNFINIISYFCKLHYSVYVLTYIQSALYTCEVHSEEIKEIFGVFQVNIKVSFMLPQILSLRDFYYF